MSNAQRWEAVRFCERLEPSKQLESGMSDDQMFRWLLLAGFLIVVPLGLWYRLKSVTAERLDRRQEGLFILITSRLCGVAVLAGLAIFFIHPASMAWAGMPVPAWLRWMGLVLGAMAGTLLIWAFHSLGPNLTDTVVTRKSHTFITNGPYRWVRHPFYLSVGLAVLANSLAAANWFFFVPSGIALPLLVLRTGKEEKNLVSRVGDDYRNYMQRTGRFLPRP